MAELVALGFPVRPVVVARAVAVAARVVAPARRPRTSQLRQGPYLRLLLAMAVLAARVVLRVEPPLWLASQAAQQRSMTASRHST